MLRHASTTEWCLAVIYPFSFKEMYRAQVLYLKFDHTDVPSPVLAMHASRERQHHITTLLSFEMLTSGAHVRQVCTAITSACVPPATLPHGNRRSISRDPAGAGSQRTQNTHNIPVLKLHASATADQSPASMAAQVDADSKIPIQELVGLAVVWASQHGLVSNSSLTVTHHKPHRQSDLH